jgi:hypothetical protein
MQCVWSPIELIKKEACIEIVTIVCSLRVSKRTLGGLFHHNLTSCTLSGSCVIMVCRKKGIDLKTEFYFTNSDTQTPISTFFLPPCCRQRYFVWGFPKKNVQWVKWQKYKVKRNVHGRKRACSKRKKRQTTVEEHCSCHCSIVPVIA